MPEGIVALQNQIKRPPLPGPVPGLRLLSRTARQ
jgi:hypothetical protein